MSLQIASKISAIRVLMILALALLSLSCAKKSKSLDLGPVILQAPAEWTSTPPTSKMRKAQFSLPRVEGDSEDGELVIYYFGGEGGSAQANLERWYGQFEQPDGASSSEKAKTAAATVDGMATTTVDLSGTYVAPVTPMDPTNRYNKPNFRMLAAVLETGEGPFFFKLVGPEKTIEKWSSTFGDFVKSAKKK
jgi:hypothetical protein